MWCWELNLCPQEEQPVLLTTEPSFQALNYIYTFWKGNFTTFLSLVWTSIELNSMPKLPPALCNYISSIVSALGKSRPHPQFYVFFYKRKGGTGEMAPVVPLSGGNSLVLSTPLRQLTTNSSSRGPTSGLFRHPYSHAHTILSLMLGWDWPVLREVSS